MKKLLQFRFILLALLLLLVFGVGVVSAQEPLAQTFVSPDGTFSFNYPASWQVQQGPSSVLVSNGTLTVEFFNISLSQTLAQLAGSNDPQAQLGSFIGVLGLTSDQRAVDVNGRTVVGAFIVDQNIARLILAVDVQQPLAQPGTPGQRSFVSASGDSVSLLSQTTTIISIIQTYGQLIDASASSVGAPAGPVSSGVPCTATANGPNVSIRSGPGTNRAVIRYLAQNTPVAVTGTANTSDGAQWWQLDKNQAAPSQAVNLNETWVAAAQVTTAGDCATVGQAAPPPIIPFRPTDAPAPPPSATAEPLPGGVVISFYADGDNITPGQCVTLYWDVRNINQVYYQGNGVVGQGSSTECPMVTTTYELRVVLNSGQNTFRYITVNVGTGCSSDDLPFSINDSIPVGGSDNWFLDIDPCQTPATIQVTMTATNLPNSLDPYIEVYADGVLIGQDDDGLGFPNSQLFVVIPAGTTQLRIVARSFSNSTGGSYFLSATRL